MALSPGGQSGIRIWNRELATYPERDARRMHLLLVVLITVTLYYELYVGSGVATITLAQLKIPFPIFVYILAAGNLLGAFASLLAGLADRFGRANLVVYDLLVVGLITLFWVPNVTTVLETLFEYFAPKMGIILWSGVVRLRHHPGGNAGADPRLRAASGAGDGYGILDYRARAGQLGSERRQHADAANLPDLAESICDLRRRGDGGLRARLLIPA